jgi:muramoyltetrapeptide carboxypeptidase
MQIGIISPSSNSAYRLPVRTTRACNNLAAALGGSVLPLEDADISTGYRAMPPSQVAKTLHEMYMNPQIGLIIAAIGGFNSNAVLRHIDWDLIKQYPTHICGYSDTSALLLGIYANIGQTVLHGPALLPQWGDPHGPFSESISSLYNSLVSEHDRCLRYAGFWVDPRTQWTEEQPLQSFHDKPRHDEPWRVLRAGNATGRLVGGNIETINMLLGTPYMPVFEEAIVFVESTGAEAYLPRLHRALTHLREADVFSCAKGLIVGRTPDANPLNGYTLDEVINEVMADTNFPILVDVDIGHTEPMLTLPVGHTATLIASDSRPSIIVYK